jgi:hypothetical protein
MEFEEMKMIWDAQNHEPLYALNEPALHRVVQHRLRDWQRSMARCFALEITIGAVCGVAMLVCASVLAFGDPAWLATVSWIKAPVTRGHVWALLAAAAIWFYYVVYMVWSRKHQQRRVEAFDSSLRGDLDRALSQTDFQVATARNIVWWGLIPVWVAVALWVATLFHLEAGPVWAYALLGGIALGGFVIDVACRQRSITNRFQPRRRELESLRAKLADPQK